MDQTSNLSSDIARLDERNCAQQNCPVEKSLIACKVRIPTGVFCSRAGCLNHLNMLHPADKR
jgi:hypothetical protein